MMANYDNKLGEWFKQLDKKEQELKAKKTVPTPEDMLMAQSSPVDNVESSATGVAREASSSVVASIATMETDMGSGQVDTYRAPERSAGSVLLETNDAPDVEDFFSFLDRNKPHEIEPIQESIAPVQQETKPVLGKLSEGTGEPRPISTAPRPEVKIDAAVLRAEPIQPQVQVTVMPAPVVEISQPKPVAEEKQTAESMQENWERVPHHLQTLFSKPSDEVAQNSYKTFKESREELISRLLDPVISLEEAARILNVCPTTVRRYTNKGVLQHLRTAGNQRRFRMSDVMSFMENGTRKA